MRKSNIESRKLKCPKPKAERRTPDCGIPKRVSRTSSGFILWEIMLALTVFCVVAVSLTSALQQAIDASIIVRDEAQVRLEIQNINTETSASKMKIGKTESKSADGRISYEREVSAVEGKTDKGEPLANMYQIKVHARWRTSGRNRSEQSALVIFQP